MKINILIDNKNSWFYEKAGSLIEKLERLGHAVNLKSDQEDLPDDSQITFFLSCEKYITRETRDKSRYNIVIHASDLPQGKGMSPSTWQILEGKDEITVTLFEVADEIDAGQWYLKNNFKLDGTELKAEWEEKLYCCIEEMALEFVRNLEKLRPKKQQGEGTTYPRRTPEDSRLDVDKTIKEQFNLLRVVDNQRYPAFFQMNGKKYIIKIYKDN